MDIILKEIVAIIKEETENINKKIYGTTFLEILKEKILNRQDQIIFKHFHMQDSNVDLEEVINVLEKNLIFKLSFFIKNLHFLITVALGIFVISEMDIALKPGLVN